MSATSLPVVNLEKAQFECTFGRGCEGVCCREGRPLIYAEEGERISAHLAKFLPHMRPSAAAFVKERGYLSSGETRLGLPMLDVEDGWCVFFNKGCVLHTVGAEEGDAYKYKPCACALFPLAKNDDDAWYVRQHGFDGEEWDLFCLAGTCGVPAAESLKAELALAEYYEAEGKTATVGEKPV